MSTSIYGARADLGNLYGLLYPEESEHKRMADPSIPRTDPSLLTSLTDRRYYEKKLGLRNGFFKSAKDWPDLDVELFCIYLAPLKQKSKYEHLRNAMMMLWPKSFDGKYVKDAMGEKLEEPVDKWLMNYDMMVKAWSDYEYSAVGGAASMSKTYVHARILVAELLASDPYFQFEVPFERNTDTQILVFSNTLAQLKKQLFGDILKAISDAAYPIHDFFNITTGQSLQVTWKPKNRKDKVERAFIRGIGMDQGSAEKSASKVQGGKSARMMAVFDEADNPLLEAVWKARGNLVNNRTTNFALLANPMNRYSQFGLLSEPEGGWSDFEDLVDRCGVYKTKRGGVSVALSSLTHPNVTFKREIVPGAVLHHYGESIRLTYGEDSPQYCAYVLGRFPKEGLSNCIVAPSELNKCMDAHNFERKPTLLSTVDPAFEGNDECIMLIGAELDGKINLERRISVPKGMGEESSSDVAISKRIKRICERFGVKAENLMIDRTGNGLAVYSGVTALMGPDVQQFNFNAGASERSIMTGEIAKEMFRSNQGAMAEAWWRMRELMECHVFGNLEMLGTDQRNEITARTFHTQSNKIYVETKTDYKKRLGKSPDTADCLAMMAELATRKGITVSLRDKAKASGQDWDPEMDTSGWESWREQMQSEELENW